MKAIFNREFKSYFTSMLGYVFLTIFLLLTGIMFYLVNVGYRMASMTGFFSSVINAAIFLLPLLTMRLFPEERKLKTDRLLFTAPVNTREIVLGKFFAAAGVLLVGTAITLIYPIILSIWGNMPLAETISCYIGFILLCFVILAIGTFMSSVTESQIVAAVSTYGVIIFTMLLGGISTYISNETVVNILLWLSPIQRFSDFTLGILNFEPVVYYISLIALFLFFSVTAVKKLNSSVLILAAVALVIAVNAFVTVLGSKFPMKIDFTSNSTFSLSDKTKEFLKDYDTEVDIYILASASDQDERISEVLSQYAAASGNIKVTNINTAENPTFGKKYTENGESLMANSVIVDSGERYKLNSMTELYGVNAQTGQYTTLNVENKINSALKYVASDKTFKAALTTGHNEMEVQGAANKLIDENYSVALWNSVTEEIPEDTTLLMIVRPTVDFSSEEITKLDNFLLSGGSVQCYFDVNSVSLTNLYNYIRSWGITVNDNFVVESDMSQTISLGSSGMSLIVPSVKKTDFTESLIDNNRTIAYFPYSKSLTQEFEANGSIYVTPVLSSSDKAYATTGNTTEKKDGDIDGEYLIAALSKDNTHNSSVYVCGNTMLLSIDPSTLANDYGLANYDYLMNLINYATDSGDSFIVGEKALVSNVISISQQTASVIFIIVVILIPLAALALGIIVWIKRRNL